MARTSTRDWFASGARVGDYQIERQLGSEETGVVYLATHVVLPRKAAIKVMHADQAWLRQIAVQMLREACLLEALDHPGIPRVYECGVLDDRRPWIAFEWVAGPTVAATIDQAPLGIADLAVVLRDVADVLVHAHERGVVHRRLTADAITRTPDRRFSLTVRQWGDACTLDTEAPISVDGRDDVRALGVLAFRALTGAMPASGISTADLCPMAPRELTALIDHMLATDPTSRPTSAEVRDRAGWLATTLETVPAKPRWTPPLGAVSDALPPDVEEAAPGFTIRISRTRTI